MTSNYIKIFLLVCTLGFLISCGGGDETTGGGATTTNNGASPGNSYTLSVTVIGAGTVTSSPVGVDCGSNCTHDYSAGTQVNLTATASGNYQFNAWSGACAGNTTNSCIVMMDAVQDVTARFTPISTGGVPLMMDDFEYVINRNDPDVSTLFAANGPWSFAKTQNSSTGAKGYIYTASQIPGYSGAFPGLNSSRVLVLEALPFSLQGQTDFYLQYGNGTEPIGHIPANHWYQFWVYPADSGIQQSLFSQGKFIYPNRATYYPATLANAGYVYILTLSKRSQAPQDLDPCPGGDSVGCSSYFNISKWNTANGLTNNVTYQEGNFGANLASDIHVVPNQWTLVKIHVDLSGTDPRAVAGQAVYEMWIRRYGNPAWIKTAEYIGGVTNVNGAPINFTPAFNDGLRMFRIPTTFGATTNVKGDWFDSWIYLDDFVMSNSEADLPVYSN